MTIDRKALEARDGARAWFISRIRDLNLTQDDVAAACGVNIRSMRTWLSGGRISRAQVPSLCDVLGVSADEISGHFIITDSDGHPRVGTSNLDKVQDLTHLMRTVLAAGCEKLRLSDLEAIAALPFNFSNLSDAEITTVQTLLQSRQKKKEAA